MKTTINQIKSFFQNHTLKDEYIKAIEIDNLLYDYKSNEALEKYGKLEVYYNRIAKRVKLNNISFRISKDLHFKFKDVKNYIPYSELPKLLVNDFDIYYSVSISFAGNTEIRYTNPLTKEAEYIFNSFNKLEEIPSIIEKEVKKLFFGNGFGYYNELQKIWLKSKSETLKIIQEIKAREKHNKAYSDEHIFDFLATLKSIKRNLGLIFNEHMDMYFITNSVNKIGKLNPKEPKKVFSFDTSFLYDFDGDINELEEEFYNHNPIKKDVLYV